MPSQDKTSINTRALINAVKKRNIEEVRTALLAGADTNSVDSSGCTALTWTCYHGEIEIARLLLDPKYKTNINHKDKYGVTALQFAASCGHTDVVDLLLAQDNIDVNAQEEMGLSALELVLRRAPKDDSIVAAATGETNVVDFLLNADNVNDTVLRCWHNNTRIIETLLNKHANPNLIDKKGETALYHAARCGNLIENINLLLIHGADIDFKHENGNTPLSIAARNGQLAITTALLKHAIFQGNNDSYDRLIHLINNAQTNNASIARKQIRFALLNILQRRFTSAVNSEHVDIIAAEIAGLINISDRVEILQERDGKEKTAMKTIKTFITQLELKQAELHIKRDDEKHQSPANAALYLALSKKKDNNTVNYLLKTEMTPEEATNLLSVLKKLTQKQFEGLKKRLKDAIPAVDKKAGLSEEQIILQELMQKQETHNELYHANPYLFILRTGTSSYEQKNTDSFNEIKEKIVGSALANTFKNAFGIFSQPPTSKGISTPDDHDAKHHP